MMENKPEPVQLVNWLQAHPADRYLVLYLDAANACVMSMESHTGDAMPGVLNTLLTTDNPGSWQATRPNCLQRAGYEPCISTGVMNTRNINPLRDLLHMRARVYLQLQAMDRQIAAELGDILNQ